MNALELAQELSNKLLNCQFNISDHESISYMTEHFDNYILYLSLQKFIESNQWMKDYS